MGMLVLSAITGPLLSQLQVGPAASSLEDSRGEGSPGSGSALSAKDFKEEPQQEGDPAPQSRNRDGGIGTCKGTGIGDWEGAGQGAGGTGQGGWMHRAEGLKGAQGGSARGEQGGSKAGGKSQALLEEANQELRETLGSWATLGRSHSNSKTQRQLLSLLHYSQVELNLPPRAGSHTAPGASDPTSNPQGPSLAHQTP